MNWDVVHEVAIYVSGANLVIMIVLFERRRYVQGCVMAPIVLWGLIAVIRRVIEVWG
jgi:hypothetical protein